MTLNKKTNVTVMIEKGQQLLFQNPSKLPLEKLYLSIARLGNTPLLVEAVNERWVEDKIYPKFPPLPEDETEENSKKWLVEAETFAKELRCIVTKTPFYIFWSNVIYEPQIVDMFESFLKNAVPMYKKQPVVPHEEIYTEIFNLVFDGFRRVLTPFESETEYITPAVLGTWLKEHLIITSSILWDISKLYGPVNDGSAEQLIHDAYNLYPDLKDELKLSVTCMGEIFEAIGTAAYDCDNPTEKIIIKLTNMLLDTAFAINMFMKMYPPYKMVCFEENLFSRIIHTYDLEVPFLYITMTQVLVHNFHPAFDVVLNAKVEMIETCHNLLNHCMDMIIQNIPNEKDIDNHDAWSPFCECVVKYLNLIDMIIEARKFLEHYNKSYSLAQEIESLMDISPKVDRIRCTDMLDKLRTKEIAYEQDFDINFDELNLQDEAGSMPIPEDVVLESQITELTDMFPHLGDGFLEQCLKSMGMNSQAVVIAILENNLPASIADLDQKMIRIPPEEPVDSVPLAGNLVEEYMGKKPLKYDDCSALLNDKSHLRAVRERFEMYSSVTEDDNIYNDDYQEIQDTDYAFGIDVDDKEEIRRPKRWTKPEDEESEEEEEVENSRSNNTFCQDPAVLRERREAQYQARGRKPVNHRPAKDVVGKPKGQGQEKDVQVSRDKKNTHKSSRANHNRRAGAQFKRNRGMIPS